MQRLSYSGGTNDKNSHQNLRDCSSSVVDYSGMCCCAVYTNSFNVIGVDMQELREVLSVLATLIAIVFWSVVANGFLIAAASIAFLLYIFIVNAGGY